MKTAVSISEQRVAPVFDTAEKICLWKGEVVRRAAPAASRFTGGSLVDKVQWLEGLGVGKLVCGAVSMTMQQALAAAGISVVPFVCGDLDDIVGPLLMGKSATTRSICRVVAEDETAVVVTMAAVTQRETFVKVHKKGKKHE